MTHGNFIDADDLLRYIREFTKKMGYTPSLTHIMNFYGVDNNAANRAVVKLIERGDLARTDRKGVFLIATEGDL